MLAKPKTVKPLIFAALAFASAAMASTVIEPIRRQNLSTERAPDGREAYIVVFRELPLARAESGSVRRYARKTLSAGASDAEKNFEAIVNRQSQFERDFEVSTPGFRSGAHYRHVLNGMSVLVPKEAVARLRQDPRVRAVYPVRRYELHLDASNTLMNAPAFWGVLGGRDEAGRGVKIADLDTGVDFSSPMFSDPSLPMPSGFPLENDGGHLANSKVIVAKYFQGVIDANDSTLDPGHRTAQDLSGHGTHTASVAAGARVTLSGPGQRPVTISGVAPKAYVGDYRVFAPSAYSDNIVAAIDAAVADGMDVINMSFGLNNADGTEPFLYSASAENEAIQNAIAAGVVVTASAGNSGSGSDTISSAANVPDLIAVGSTTNLHQGIAPSQLGLLSVTAGNPSPDDNLKEIIGTRGGGTSPPPFPSAPINAPFADYDNFDGTGDSLGCTSLPGTPLLGDIALIQRGNCTFAAKILNAQSAGARAVVLYNSAAGGDTLLSPEVSGTSIPALFVTRTDGLNLKAYLDANAGPPPASFANFGPAPAGTPPATFATSGHNLSVFSSAGPTIDFQIKPDLTSVGEGCYSAVQDDDERGEGRFPSPDPYSGRDSSAFFDLSGFAFGQGTSFSAPRVAGAAALLVQKHPDWSPAEIKAALMETAVAPRDPADPAKVGNFSVQRRGSGDVDLAAASGVGSIILPPNHSFRRVILEAIPPADFLTRTFVLENRTFVTLTYHVNANATPALSDPAVVPSVFPEILTLSPGARGTFTLTLNLSEGLQTGEHDSEGTITVSDGKASIPDVLTVPYWIRLVFRNGAAPLLRNISAHLDAHSTSQVDVDYSAHDDDADIASYSIRFFDGVGQEVAGAENTFAGQLPGTDAVGEIQVTGVTTSSCPGCEAVSLQFFDSAGNASNTLFARYVGAFASPVVAAPSAYVRTIPSVVHEEATGALKQSDVRIFNPSSAHILALDLYLTIPTTAQVTAPPFTTLHTAHFVLPRQSLALDDICANEFGEADTAGSLVLVSGDGSPFLASSRTSTRSDFGTRGSAVGSLLLSETPAPGGKARLNGLPAGAGFHTNVGAAETGGVETTVQFDGFAADGSSAGSFTADLPPYGSVKFTPDSDAAHQFTAPPSRIDLAVVSGGRAAAFAESIDEQSGDTAVSLFRVASATSTPRFLTETAHAHGANGTLFTTDVSVSNLSAGPSTFSLSLLPAFLSGAPASPAPITLTAGQSITLSDVLRNSFGLSGDSGAGIRIDPALSSSILVSGKTSTPNSTGGAFGYFMPPYSASDALSGSGRQVAIHLAQNRDFRTNFGFTEISGSPVSVRATFFDENGTPWGSRVYELAPLSTLQTNVRDVIGAAAPGSGYLEFTIESGSGKVLSFGAVVDNFTGDVFEVRAEPEP